MRDDQRIPKDQIAVHTGPRKDLDDIADIRSDKCPVRYIITVSKLKEGWDCPFAYILCSVADQVSATAVEQILGRVLRMPRAQRKRRDALSRASPAPPKPAEHEACPADPVEARLFQRPVKSRKGGGLGMRAG